MTADEYQKLAMQTNSHQPMKLPDRDLLNGVMGLVGESGEMDDHLKKHMFQGHELDKTKLIKELGDVCWYAAQAAVGLGISLEEVMAINIQKLAARYPDGHFTVEHSTHRKEGDI